MELKEGYQQTEVGVIPSDWNLNELAKIGQLTKGRGLLKHEIFPSGSIPAIPYTAIYTDFDEVLDYEKIKWFVERANSSVVLSNPCVLIASSSNMDANTGKATAVKGGFPVAVGREVIIFQTPHNTSFISYLLSTSLYRKKTLALARGTTIKHVYPATFRNYKICVPSYGEQNAIAEALSDADALIASLDQLITKKRQIKQGAMQDFLTGKRRLPGFSDEWKVKTFGELFTFSGGYSASRDQLSTEGYCYLHYGDIHGSKKSSIDTHSEYLNIPKLKILLKKVSPSSLLKDGDVVFVDASEDYDGTSRHIVVVNKGNEPFISGLHTIVAKSKTDELVNEYKQYCFKTPSIHQQFLFYAVGTKVSGISKTNISKLTLPIPSSPEQVAIAAALRDMDTELVALESRLAKARSIKQGMMQELLTGRIRLL